MSLFLKRRSWEERRRAGVLLGSGPGAGFTLQLLCASYTARLRASSPSVPSVAGAVESCCIEPFVQPSATALLPLEKFSQGLQSVRRRAAASICPSKPPGPRTASAAAAMVKILTPRRLGTPPGGWGHLPSRATSGQHTATLASHNHSQSF